MGRERRKKVVDAEMANTGSTSATYHQQLLELLSCIDEMGGVSSTASKNRKELTLRRKMILNLKNLQTSLTNLSKSFDRDETVASDRAQQQRDDKFLIQLEEDATQIRFTCEELCEVFIQERTELSQILRDIENLCCKHAQAGSETEWDLRATLFVRSLVTQYRCQLQLEQSAVDDAVTFLSTLYDGVEDSVSTHVDMIQRWIQCLDERIQLDRLVWNNLSIFIEKLEGSNMTTRIYPSQLQNMPTHPANEEYCQDACCKRAWDSKKKKCIVAEETVSGAVDVFLKQEEGYSDEGGSGFTMLLLVGNSGSGKTHVCNIMERKICDANAALDNESTDRITVIRPSLPLDLMGSSVGETEDLIVSLFGYACSTDSGNKCVMILDDIEHILGDSFAAPMNSASIGVRADEGESHVIVRARSTFLSILDVLKLTCREQEERNMETLVLCTARDASDDMVGRFDKIFVLGQPNEQERRSAISSCLALDALLQSNLPYKRELDTLLDDLAEMTVGRSFAEISQYCRGACSTAGGSDYQYSPDAGNELPDSVLVLRAMKESLSNIAPESLRTGSLDDFVDIKVFSARELLVDQRGSEQDSPLLPLFGDQVEEAWRQMDGLVVAPLCRAKALDEILFGCRQKAARKVCAGVLLTGPPGCGKSALAFHCARVAASMLPSVTLLDVSCTSLVHKEVGGSERAVQRLFSAARAAAPCILLMDGIENIAAVRGNDNTTEGTMDRMLSTLLTELDGIDDELDSSGGSTEATSGGIAVIGVTHDHKWIDPALRRPGRLEKVIRLTHPDYEARLSIVLNEIEKLPIDFLPTPAGAPTSTALTTCHDLAEFIALQCESMSAAEVIAICKEACMIRARKELDLDSTSEETPAMIQIEDFVSAVDMRKHGTSS